MVLLVLKGWQALGYLLYRKWTDRKDLCCFGETCPKGRTAQVSSQIDWKDKWHAPYIVQCIHGEI